MTVYFIRDIHNRGPIKIGYTGSDLPGRLRSLQAGSPIELKIIKTIEGDSMLELAIHSFFCSSRLSNEWFEATPGLLNFIDSPDISTILQGFSTLEPSAISAKPDPEVWPYTRY